MSKHLNIYNALLAVVLATVLSSCIGKKSTDENDEKKTTPPSQTTVTLTKQQFNAIGVTTGTFIKKNLSDVIKLNGLLEIPPRYRAKVTAMINGSVTKIMVKQGDQVKQGDILAYISHPDIIQLQQDYLETQSQLTYNEKDYLRQKELIAQNATAVKNFEKTESDYNSQKYRLLSLEKKLRLINLDPTKIAKGYIYDEASIVSPISGSINSVSINIGSSVATSEQLFEISDNNKIQATLLVYEKDITKLKIGQTLQIAQTGELSKTFDGTIVSISKNFEKDVNAVKIYADIKGNSDNLIHGSYIEARLQVKDNLVETLPDEAFIREGENTYIFIMSDKLQKDDDLVFKHILVKTGVSDLGFTEATPLETIENGYKIVLKGAYELNAKMKSSESDDD